MSYRKRLRKRGYVLMSDKRATSVIDLRRWLDESKRARTLASEFDHDRFDEVNARADKLGVAIALLEVKYKIAIDRIAELENADE